MIDSIHIASVVYLEFLKNLGLYIVVPLVVIMLIWQKLKVKPASRFIYAVSAWVILWVTWRILGVSDSPDIESVRNGVGQILQYGTMMAVFLIVLDFIILLILPDPISEREIPKRFASGVSADIKLKLSNPAAFDMKISFHDGLPEEAICEVLPWQGILPSRGYVELTYPLEFNERGDSYVEASYMQYQTRLSFWSRTIRTGAGEETKVYPNYEPIVRYALLTMESSPEQMGIVMKNRIGMSKEFHQLRDYQLGDMLSQIDWKATSKHRSLISRDYQEQKDQNVILAIDCGRRMRAYDGDVPQFDHCLNAMLLLSYVALRQGDHVGILSFGGQENWLPPVKGVQSMTTLINHMYDYKTSNTPSDFSEAAERLLTRQRRRALVIVLTNVRGEDGEELIEPLRKMRQKHVVMVANLRERDVVESYGKEVNNLDDALTLASSQIYFNERAAMMRQLESHGICTVDETAQRLPVALANRYLAARENV